MQSQSVVLKLNRVGTYVSPLSENQLLEKGDLIRVDRKAADHMLKGQEAGVGEDMHPHFKIVDDADDETDVKIDAVKLKAERLAAEREAKGLPPATLARREAADMERVAARPRVTREVLDEDADPDAGDEEPAATARRSIKRALPVKRVPAGRKAGQKPAAAKRVRS